MIPIPANEMFAGYKPTTNIFPPVIIPPAVGFVCEPAESPHRVLSVQNAVVVRVADIGAQIVLGIVRDREEPMEGEIIYGLSSNAGQVRALENSLGRSLFDLLETGRVVSSLCEWGREGGWKRLLWLSEIRSDPNAKSIAQDSSCLPGAVRHGLSQQMVQAQARRSAVLALRKKWSLSESVSKKDAPGWLPRFAVELMMSSSAWVALPDSADSAPTSSTPPRPRR